MKKYSEYLHHAEECRALARGLPAGKLRDQLLAMAEAWDRIAAERKASLAGEPAADAGHPQGGSAGAKDDTCSDGETG